MSQYFQILPERKKERDSVFKTVDINLNNEFKLIAIHK